MFINIRVLRLRSTDWKLSLNPEQNFIELKVGVLYFFTFQFLAVKIEAVLNFKTLCINLI